MIQSKCYHNNDNQEDDLQSQGANTDVRYDELHQPVNKRVQNKPSRATRKIRSRKQANPRKINIMAAQQHYHEVLRKSSLGVPTKRFQVHF